MKTITIDQLFHLLHDGNEGKFFSVTFTKKSDNTERTMLCRTGVSKYTKGILPPGERLQQDYKNSVLTVWDMIAYNKNLKEGQDKQKAAMNAYRRINIPTITQCSLLDKTELPPNINTGD
jgi:hypothetical protein